MNILIAAMKKVLNPQEAFNIMAHAATVNGLTLHGMVVAPGPGCTNIALRVTGDEEEIERYANAVTMVLMPARWGTTADAIPDGVTVRE